MGLTSRKCPGRAVQGNVIKPDVLEKLEAAFDFLEYLISDNFLPGGQGLSRLVPGSIGVDFHYPFQGLTYVLGAYVHYSQLADLDRQCFRAQPLAIAGPAGTGRHVPLNLLAGVVGLGLLVAPFQIWDHALEVGVPAVNPAPMGPMADSYFFGPVAVENQVQLVLGEVPYRVFGGEAVGGGNGLQQAHVPTGGRTASRPWGYCSFRKGQRLVKDHQVRVHF